MGSGSSPREGQHPKQRDSRRAKIAAGEGAVEARKHEHHPWLLKL